MKLKHSLRRLAALALCAALLIPAAGAADVSAPADPAPLPATHRTWGTVTHLEGGSLMLQNDTGAENTMDELILHVDENTLILNAATGMPIALADVKDGETVYVNTSPVMTMSLPAQTYAVLILAQLPADMAAPAYYEVTGFQMISTKMTQNNRITATVSTDQGDKLTFSLTDKLDESGARQYILKDAVEFTPYLTRNIVSVLDLVPGARILVWADAAGKPSKVMVFPYAYRGYLEVLGDTVLLNGETTIPGRPSDDLLGLPQLPLRSVCEALGLTVTWNAKTRALAVAEGDTVLFTYALGATSAQANGETVDLVAPAETEGGAVYLRALDLAGLLNLYLPL